MLRPSRARDDPRWMKALLHVVIELAVVAAVVWAVCVTPPAVQLLTAPSADERLREAAWAGDEELFDIALAGGASVHGRDASGTTALHYAALAGEVTLVARLLESGADPNVRNGAGMTPIIEAAVADDDAVVNMLLRGGAVAGDDALVAAERADAGRVLTLLRRWRGDFPGALTGGRHVQANRGGDRQQ